jgi:hypothetical protein
MCAAWSARTGAPSCTARRSGARPELFPVRHHARAARFLRFPLGDLPKPPCAKSRRAAAAVAEKPDSQDICFVPSGDYASVVKKVRPEAAQEGEIVDLEGRVLGRHRGLIHFTVGQRRGLEIGGQPSRSTSSGSSRRARVVVGSEARACGARGAAQRDQLARRGRSGDGADGEGALAWRARAGRVRRAEHPLRAAGIWRGAGPGRGALQTAIACSAAAGSRIDGAGLLYRRTQVLPSQLPILDALEAALA